MKKENLKLTEAEKHILLSLPCIYQNGYIARTKAGNIMVFTYKPFKVVGFMWQNEPLEYFYMKMFNHLFQFIEWDDNEPYSIKYLLEECC